jgi:hypothetical protein
MNANLSSDRILVGNRIITVAAIVSADYNPNKRHLSIFLIDKTEINLRDEVAESTWDYLTSRIYGCTEPLSLWQQCVKRSSEIRVNE